MIIYKKGSIFSAAGQEKQVILAHACNCKGRWGSGVAVGFRNNYQNAYNHYMDHCAKYGVENLGTTLLVRDKDNVFVACLFTSDGYADTLDSEESILYNTELAIKDLVLKSSNLEIHMVKINSGLFRVPWEKTEEILKKFVPEDKVVVVWEP